MDKRIQYKGLGRNKQLDYALSLKIVQDHEKLKAEISTGGVASEKLFNEIKRLMNLKMKIIHDSQFGYDITKPLKHFTGQKDLAIVGGGTSVDAGTYRVFNNEFNVDMDWMGFFNGIDAEGAETADIIDFVSKSGWKEYPSGKKIEPRNFGVEDFANLREKRFADGISAPWKWVRNNGRYVVDSMMNSILMGEMEFKAKFAYELLADTTGVSTQTFDTSLIKTLNAAYVALLKANSNKGFALDARRTPVKLLVALENYDEALIAVNTVRNMGQGSERIVEYPVEVVPTTNVNVPATIGGVAAGILILPGFKNIWANFGAMRSSQEMQFRSDSLEMYAQEYWNAQAAAVQKRIVPFAEAGS